MLRTVEGALRRLTKPSRNRKEWYADEITDLGDYALADREQRLELLRGNRANYETITSTVKLR